MRTATAVRGCSTPGCSRPHKARGFCHPCYKRWRHSLPGHQIGAPERPPASDKIAYLGSLTLGELHAYCSGVLSRASIAGGDPDEIATWVELVRLTASRTAE